MGVKVGHIRPVVTLAFFIAYFSLVFLPHVLHQSLPGHADTLYNLALFRDYGNRLLSVLNGTPVGHAFFPEPGLQWFSEPYLGEAFIFLVFKSLGFPDYLAYYFFNVSLYSLNAFAAFLLARHYFGNGFAAVVTGIMVGGSAFAYSQIELLNGIPLFPFLLSLLYFEKYLEHFRKKDLLISLAFGGMQIYFSAYIFVYQTVILLLLAVFRLKKIKASYKALFDHLPFLLIYPLIIYPFAHIYLFFGPITGAYNPLTFEIARNFNLHFSDLARSLPGNLLYPRIAEPQFDTEVKTVNYCNIGVLIYLLALGSLFIRWKRKWFWLTVCLLGLLFSFGPEIRIGGSYYPTLLYPIYEVLPVQDFLRIPVRAFSIFVAGLAFLATGTLSKLIDKSKQSLWICLFIVILFTLENSSFKPTNYPATDFLPERELLVQLEKMEDHQKVIAFLPSTLFEDRNSNGTSEFVREFHYCYWQTFLKKNTINGVSSFLPKSRMTNNQLMIKANPEALAQLIEQNGLDYLVFSKKLVLDEREWTILENLKKLPGLSLKFENESFTLFARQEEF